MLKKILLGGFLLVSLVVSIAVIYFVMMFNLFDDRLSESFISLERGDSELRVEEAEEITNSFTVLILGIDELSEEDDPGDDEVHPDARYHRSDTMILATFNKDIDEVKLIGIPRDTITYIEHVEYFDKINHAHMFGGPDAAAETVESLLNVPVDYYVRVNMSAVVDIVDALGGVKFDVPFDMNEPNSSNTERIILSEGEQLLDGESALAVVRSRRVDSDLARNNRQIEMVYKIMEKAKSTNAIMNLEQLIDVVSENITHNIPSEEMRGLASYYAFNNLSFNSVQLRGQDFWTENRAAYFYRADDEHLYLISNTLRRELGLEINDDAHNLINIRLRDYIEPYVTFDDYMLYDYRPEEAPYFTSYYYVSKLGDGINIPELEPDEHGIEGEDDLELDPADDVQLEGSEDAFQYEYRNNQDLQ